MADDKEKRWSWSTQVIKSAARISFSYDKLIQHLTDYTLFSLQISQRNNRRETRVVFWSASASLCSVWTDLTNLLCVYTPPKNMKKYYRFSFQVAPSFDGSVPCTCSFIEIMAPVFSRDAWRCVWHMIQVETCHLYLFHHFHTQFLVLLLVNYAILLTWEFTEWLGSWLGPWLCS